MRSPVRIWIAAPFKSPWPMARGFSRFLASLPAVTDFAVFKKPLSFGCLRIRNHCPPTDDFAQLLCQSSLPASKDACAAFPFTSPKSAGRRVRSSSGPEICAQSALERVRGILDVFPSPLQGAMGQISQPEPMFSYLEAALVRGPFLSCVSFQNSGRKRPPFPFVQGNGGHLQLHLTTGYRSARYSRH